MNATTPLTDELIRAAMARRATSASEADLRERVLAATGAASQRRGWISWPSEAFVGTDRRRAIVVLAALALLVATSVALVLVGSGKLAPDGGGRGLAFISGGDLWIADDAGASPRLAWDMPAPAIASRPTWVDADTVLIQEVSGGVYAVDLRTSTARLVASAGALLAVSPDRRQVAIGFDRSDGPHVSIVDIASGSQVSDVLVRPAYVAPATPQIGPQGGLTGGPHAWSPDGRWLLGQGFDTDASDTSGWIYQLDIQTGQIRDLATELCCGLHKPNPVLAPDGSLVVYMNFHQASPDDTTCNFRCGTLWALDPASGARRQLTEEAGSETGPVFSPDGTWIAFAEYVGSGYDVSIVRPDGTGRRKLTGIGDAYAPVANIEPYTYLAWDADGGGLTLFRGPRVQTEWQLWHVNIAGLPPVRLGTITASEFAR